MKDDLLEEATRALRASGNEANGSDLTRGRIMQSLHAEKRKRSSRWAFGLPVAAVFVASAAAAQVTGVLPRAIERVADVFRGEPTPAQPTEPAAPALRGSGAPQASVSPPAPAQPADRVAATPVAPEESADGQALPELPAAPATPMTARAGSDVPVAPRAVGSAQPSASGAAPAAASAAASDSPPAPASEPAADASHARYLEAHHAHFSAHDYARALGLWERYLKEFPRGRFAAEAQYNRAVCLVRLGRYAAAKSALEPFADGRYGGYRQSEARALIAALAPSAPSGSAP